MKTNNIIIINLKKELQKEVDICNTIQKILINNGGYENYKKIYIFIREQWLNFDLKLIKQIEKDFIKQGINIKRKKYIDKLILDEFSIYNIKHMRYYILNINIPEKYKEIAKYKKKKNHYYIYILMIQNLILNLNKYLLININYLDEESLNYSFMNDLYKLLSLFVIIYNKWIKKIIYNPQKKEKS